jgi:hypothetical protein
MKIYHYNEEGLFICEGYADPDPLRPGHWLIPAFATTIEPPIPGENQIVRFQNDHWILEDIPVPEPEPELPEPTPEEIKQQQIDSLNNEFIPQFQMLRDSFLSAQLANNQEAMLEITADYQALWQEYNSRMEAIEND